MTKTEFLQELQDSLRGEVSPSIIQETVNYYTRYINEAVADGQTEQAVLESLGPARLIAKSIIEANSVKRNAETTGQTQKAQKTQEEAPKKRSGFTFRSWYGRLLLILLALVAVGIILALIVGAVVVVWKLLPVLAVIILIIVLVRVFLRIGKD